MAPKKKPAAAKALVGASTASSVAGGAGVKKKPAGASGAAAASAKSLVKKKPSAALAAAAEAAEAAEEEAAEEEEEEQAAEEAEAPAEEPSAKSAVKRKPAAASAAEAGGEDADEDAAQEPLPKVAKISGGSGGSLSDVLQPVRSGLAAATGEEEQTAALLAVTQQLMNEWDLLIGGERYAIAELEAYINGPAHQDPYTHADEGQGSCGVWYFHRKGGSYKGGTFKGMDLASGDASANVAAGLLLRTIEKVSPPGESRTVIEGPCMVVDHILSKNSKESIASFADGRSAAELPADATDGLTLVPAETPRSTEVWVGPRVGLVLRGDEAGKTHSEGKPSDFVARFYRFSTAAPYLKKFRAGFAAAKYVRGGRGPAVSAAAIADELKLAKAHVEKYLEAVDKGVDGGSTAPMVDRPINTAADLCELVGACFATKMPAAGA